MPALKSIFRIIISTHLLIPFCSNLVAQVQHGETYEPNVAEASNEAAEAVQFFEVAEGLKVDVVAAEPMLANPVAFTVDEKGNFYIAETFRHETGVLDIRGRFNWINSRIREDIPRSEQAAYEDELLDADLSSRTVSQRISYLKRYMGDEIDVMTQDTERIRKLVDTDGDAVMDQSTVYADDFFDFAGGLGSGLLARDGKVWFTNIPDLWLLEDTDGDGVADETQSLHHGYGVRTGFLGHDLHGLVMGHDGRIYFSIGDRGAHIETFDGRLVSNPDSGAVFRCYPDGSELEIFAVGLRNPQELAFDNYGNLFTGDNNSDGGDEARWVYLVEGGDSGWRIGYQFFERPVRRGPWNAERLWYPQWEGQAAHIIPPVANIGNGPSGLTYYPGTGLSDKYENTFFLADFRGSTRSSGIHTIRMKPKGAGFEIDELGQIIWNVLVTDADFAYNGGLYLTDWINGWAKTGKGRIYRIHDEAIDQSEVVQQTARFMSEGMKRRSITELSNLLSWPDRRVRLEAQLELATRGLESVSALTNVAQSSDNQLARLHAVWGLGQLAVKRKSAPVGSITSPLLALLSDPDSEVRNQAAIALGDAREPGAYETFITLLKDPDARVRYSAAMGLGKLGRKEAVPAILEMATENNDEDPYLRHAAVMALTRINDWDSVLAAASSSARPVRMVSLLAMRRLQREEIGTFLKDEDLAIVREAARAINDGPISSADRELAELINAIPEDEPILLRSINANFRTGTREAAERLVSFAADGERPDDLRGIALAALAEWPEPSGRDHVTGVWRPLWTSSRDASIPAEALDGHLPEMFTAGEPVQMAAIDAVTALNFRSADGPLAGLVIDESASGRVRAAALRALEAIGSSRLVAVLEAISGTTDRQLRATVNDVASRVRPSDALAQLTTALENGSVEEKQSALNTLSNLDGEGAAQIIGQWLEKLISGEAAPAVQLDILEAAAARPEDSIQQRLATYRSAHPAGDNVDAYSELLYGGDADRGRTVFFERLDVSCLRCHKMDGTGGEAGPDLTGVGSRRDRRHILESIMFPNAQITEGFTNQMIETRNGNLYSGVIREENDSTINLVTIDSGVVEINKRDIVEREQGLSGMPPGMGQILSKPDLRDLVEYLANSK